MRVSINVRLDVEVGVTDNAEIAKGIINEAFRVTLPSDCLQGVQLGELYDPITGVRFPVRVLGAVAQGEATVINQ